MTRPLLCLAALATAACGGDGAPGTGGPPPTVGGIVLSQSTLAFDALGRTATLTATVTDPDGNPISGVVVSWTHRVGGVTTVNGSGVVTATGNGVDTVVAAVGTTTAQAVVTVSQQPVALSLSAGQLALTLIGATQLLTARVLDANDRDIPGATVVWNSSAPQVLVVNDGGQVTAVGPGTAVISAASGSLSDNVAMQVNITGPVGPAVVGGSRTCSGGSAAGFPCSGIDLVAYLPNAALGAGPTIPINDLWGWTDGSSGRDYAIVGRQDGVAFVDVTTPETPRYLGFLPITPGANPNAWHDVKVYQNHAFIVADGAGGHGMQVFDLTRLRNPPDVPRTFTSDQVYTGVASAHNIVINEATGFAYITGASSGGTTCGGGLHMVNIQSPLNPTFAGCFAHPATGRSGTGYTHDAQCVLYNGPDASYQGREICFNSNETHVSIADVTNKSAPVAISKVSYPNAAYTHQGWLSEDHAYLFVNDELDDAATAGTRTLVWDVADLEDPILVKQYLGPTEATDHNNYVVGQRLYASNYQFGIRVLDISDPTNPSQVGYFDTAPEYVDAAGFGGSWSNYPFFASGIIVVTSREEGLFILRVP
jgi:choice-of-anchor B domain-containing protein